MVPTGERFLPEMNGAYIAYEHWHRYLFATKFVRGKCVLDVACGEGYGSNQLAGCAAQVVGVDLDPEAVRHASTTYHADNLFFQCGPAEQIPIPGEHLFDVIVSFETLEHLTAEGQTRFAKEVKRLLKPTGLLLISTPNRLVYSEQDQYHNPFHLHEFDRVEFEQYLAEHFTQIQMLCQRIYPTSYIWNSDSSNEQYDEFQLMLKNGKLWPASVDGKEQRYFIALCSNQEQTIAPNSVMLDVAEVAVRGFGSHLTTLFLDTGANFSEEEAFRVPFTDPANFRLEFTLDSRPVKRLRWDPVEQRLCKVWLTSVSWLAADGQVHELDLAAITTNGTAEGENAYRFDSFDPMIFLPVEGSIQSLTIAGRCEIDDLAASMHRMNEAVNAARTQMVYQRQTCEKENSRLVSCLKVSGETSSKLAARVQALEVSSAQLTAQLKISKEANSRLASQLEVFEKERIKLTARIRNYEQDNSRLTNRLLAAAATRGRLQTRLTMSEENLAEQGRRLQLAEARCRELTYNLGSVLSSKRWRWVNVVRSLCYFFPRLLVRTWRSVGRRYAN